MMWLVVLSSVILMLSIWPGNTSKNIYRNDGLGYLSVNSKNNYVCGAAEVSKWQLGKCTASKYSPAKVL